MKLCEGVRRDMFPLIPAFGIPARVQSPVTNRGVLQERSGFLSSSLYRAKDIEIY
jgi:hypothetical protein